MNINAISHIRAIKPDQERLKNVRKNSPLFRNKDEEETDLEQSKNMLQPTETRPYRRASAKRWRNDSAFIAQYIHQRKNERNRSHVGRRPAMVANKIYDDVEKLGCAKTALKLDEVI